jgi:2-succinyl-5-enolpyruvyl-6-hydroxy-3-cyclohexene-1-carboxylate synthase
LRTAPFDAKAPAIVLRVGAPWASKVLNQWLDRRPPAGPEVLIDHWGRWADPERRASHLARTTAGAIADVLVSGGLVPAPTSDWALAWQEGERSARSAIDRLLGPDGSSALSEPAVASSCWCHVGAGGTLFVSSSMPVRDVEWYAPPVAGARALSNRGANGIDGVVSTAVGVAIAHPDRPTIGLLGDLAFVYDAGALLRAAERPARLRLVVVDNDGGGIFSFLPQAAAFPAERFEQYWGTPHGIDLVTLARAYGVPAERVTSRADLDRFLAARAQERTGIEVAVVPSDRAANVAVHDRVHAAVADAVA